MDKPPSTYGKICQNVCDPSHPDFFWRPPSPVGKNSPGLSHPTLMNDRDRLCPRPQRRSPSNPRHLSRTKTATTSKASKTPPQLTPSWATTQSIITRLGAIIQNPYNRNPDKLAA
jgi:hypothetical protein